MLAQLPDRPGDGHAAPLSRRVPAAARTLLNVNTGQLVGAELPPSADTTRLLDDIAWRLRGIRSRRDVILTVGRSVVCSSRWSAPTARVIGVVGSAEDTTQGQDAAHRLEMHAPCSPPRSSTRQRDRHLRRGRRFVYVNAASRQFAELDSDGTTFADGDAVWACGTDERDRA